MYLTERNRYSAGRIVYDKHHLHIFVCKLEILLVLLSNTFDVMDVIINEANGCLITILLAIM